MSNKGFIFVEKFKFKKLIMGILSTIDKVTNAVQSDVIDGKVVYIELDQDNFNLIKKEVEDLLTPENSTEVTFEFNKKVSDMGYCGILKINGWKVIVTINKDKKDSKDFYFAFKTKVI